jgi:DNA-nicking Smr family endonuclease
VIGRRRTLAPEEAALWRRVVASVTPLHRQPPATAAPPQPASGTSRPAPPPPTAAPHPPRPASVPARSAAVRPGTTLDAGWDRRLARGLVQPESTVDLHGHSLASAHDRLDAGLEAAIRRGDRVLLLVTGKPPRAESERPHARGAIRAAVGDWLAGSRHAGRIAAVRGAHPRHGGAGALYIVLRRPAASRKS